MAIGRKDGVNRFWRVFTRRLSARSVKRLVAQMFVCLRLADSARSVKRLVAQMFVCLRLPDSARSVKRLVAQMFVCLRLPQTNEHTCRQHRSVAGDLTDVFLKLANKNIRGLLLTELWATSGVFVGCFRHLPEPFWKAGICGPFRLSGCFGHFWY